METREKTMPLWISAEIILRETIQKDWEPRFVKVDDYSAHYAVLKNEFLLYEAAPEEDREILSSLFVKAKKRLLDAVGFNLEQASYMPATERTFCMITEQLNQKIHVYETENGYDAKEMFLQAILYDKWEMPAVRNIRIEIDVEEPDMNEEIFKLEELLKENGIPFYFNYREENRPTPFSEGGESKVDWSKVPLVITVGPLMPNGITPIKIMSTDMQEDSCVFVFDASENIEITESCKATAEQAFEIIKENFMKHRAEWWPAVYGNEK